MLPLCLALTTLPPNLPDGPRRNGHPLVLVGGFTVWGREEFLGVKYWGGPRRDIEKDLASQGHRVVTAAVGPLSSNWDRACELYALLKGGRVDYGQAHAKTHGHARFGRTHPGLLQEWGTSDAQGRLKKAHFLGHSMGGQTIRVLEALLAEGSAAERGATASGDLSPLFTGGKPWVASLSTFATPHNGTTLVWKREGLLEPAQRFLSQLATFNGPGWHLYDVKLDHWGLERKAGEGVLPFLARLKEGPLAKARDFAPYDLSPEGAAELNAWAKGQPQVFHFSWSTCKTRAKGDGLHHPEPLMTLPWHAGARYMGRTAQAPGHPPLDPSWFPNDGVVNTVSMAGPKGEPIQAFQGQAKRGEWTHMGVLAGWDHTEMIGFGPQHGLELLPFYRRWAAFLATLEE